MSVHSCLFTVNWGAIFAHRAQMLINRAYSTAASLINWRIQFKQNQLVSQISSILIQRHNWVTLLNNLNLSLSSYLTPPLFHQILHKTQSHPQISLNFFNYAVSHLKFNPDLKSQCFLVHVLFGSGLIQPANTILDSLVRIHPSDILRDTMVKSCRGNEISQSNVLSFVLQCYLHKGLLIGGLEVYNKMRLIGCIPSTDACNSLLSALQRENMMKLGLCLYGAMIRIGISPDKLTWSVIARILNKDGNFERIAKLLDMGFCNLVMYNSVIDSYSRLGDFEACFDRLNEMSERKLNPSFGTFSSILDGACKWGNVEVVDRVMSLMSDKGFLSHPSLEFDSVIQKLCNLGMVNAATMFFRRACDDRTKLRNATYGCMLKAYSLAGQLEEAMGIHRQITESDISIKNNAREAFVDLLCKEDHSEESCKILKEIIESGFRPRKTSFSKYISLLCNKQKWKEAEEVMQVALEKGFVPNTLICCNFVEHYCCSKQIDKAVELHSVLEKLGSSLDVKTYNVFLDGLVTAGRGEKAIRVFEYMKGLDLVDGASFAVVIQELCRLKEMRKAMKLHDEMLSRGLKPDKAVYKRLILGFKL